MRVGVSSLKTRSWFYLLSRWLVFHPWHMGSDDWWRGGSEEWLQIPVPLQLLLKNRAAVDIVGNPCRRDEVGSSPLLFRYPLTSWSDSQTVPRNHPNLVQPPLKADATGVLSFQLCWMSLSNRFLMTNFSVLRETSKMNTALRSEVAKIWIL